jgi:hypothetical protein
MENILTAQEKAELKKIYEQFDDQPEYNNLKHAGLLRKYKESSNMEGDVIAITIIPKKVLFLYDVDEDDDKYFLYVRFNNINYDSLEDIKQYFDV